MNYVFADLVLHLHEARNMRATQVDARTIDHMSCFGKRATVECKRLFDGPVGTHNSKFMTFLVVIFVRLILAFEKGVQFVSDELPKIVRNGGRRPML